MLKILALCIFLGMTSSTFATQHEAFFSGIGILEKFPKNNKIVLKSDVYERLYFLSNTGDFIIGDTVRVYGKYKRKKLKDHFPKLKVITIEPYDCCRLETKGDINADGQIAINDFVMFVSYLFYDYKLPICSSNSDVNEDGVIDVADLVRLVEFAFQNEGTMPPCEE